MSLISILKKKNKIECFTTPSHSQKFYIFSKLRQIYKYDISETDAYNPQEALRLAQKKASEIYGTKSTHFLTNGSTSGVIAAVLAAQGRRGLEEWNDRGMAKLESHTSIPPYLQSSENIPNLNKKILIWNNAHICHKNAVTLAGAEPVFYELEKDEEWGIYGAVSPDIIEQKLKDGGVNAVVITSPSYYGVVSDVKSISEVCKKYGAYLIVDEAHGALYPFFKHCDKLPTSAIYLGADFVVQSLHKTAGGLNPTALLHCQVGEEKGKGEREAERLRSVAAKPLNLQASQIRQLFDCSTVQLFNSLKMISTTSPSYPLLASIEKNINFLNSQRGRKQLLELVEHIENMKKNLPNCEFYEGDPTKILVKVPKLSGFELSETLFEKYKIEDEITNEKSAMLLCGIGTDLKKLKKLERALKNISSGKY